MVTSQNDPQETTLIPRPIQRHRKWRRDLERFDVCGMLGYAKAPFKGLIFRA
jgi:hypothetical protein